MTKAVKTQTCDTEARATREAVVELGGGARAYRLQCHLPGGDRDNGGRTVTMFYVDDARGVVRGVGGSWADVVDDMRSRLQSPLPHAAVAP